MKIKAHNSSFCGERKLRVRRVLERPAADQSIGLPHEVIGAVADGEEVTVLGDKDGVFGSLKPNNPVDKGGRGAWQIGVRASEFDASPITVVAGKTNRATAMTYGITWFATENARFMINYVDTKFDALVGSSGSRVTGDRAIMFRSQLNF